MTVQYQGVWSLQSAAQLQSTQRWVTDPLFENTTLLLQADDAANGSQNNTFLDSSSNAFAITRNGNTTQGSFTPFSLQPGAWSVFFDGSGDSFSVSTSTVLDLNGAIDFTIEAWVYLTGYGSTSDMSLNIANKFTGAGGLGYTYGIFGGGANQGKIQFYGAAGSVSIISTNAIPLNSWNHVAIVKNGTTYTHYLNGVANGSQTTTSTLTASANALVIGDYGYADDFLGYMSNLRITKNGAVYTSGFIPPISPLTTSVSTGTVSLLTFQSNRFVDNSSNGFTLTPSGTPSVQPFSPFAPQFQWTPSVIGGSGYFDGTGDSLTMASSSAFAVGTVFTMECWIYPLTSGTSAGQPFFVNGTTAEIQFGYQGATSWGIAANNVVWRLTSSTMPFVNAWNHVVVVRSGLGTNQTSLFLNGTRVANGTVADTFTSAGTGNIGLYGSGTYTGYISSLRIVKGTAVYDPSLTTCTVPTAPLTAITNTQLLTNFTNAGIYDGTMKNNLETVGNAQVSTAVVKYGSGSMYFDGTGDWCLAPNNLNFSFGSGDFTVEFWAYDIARSSNGTCWVSKWGSPASLGRSWIIYYDIATTSLSLATSTDGSAGANLVSAVITPSLNVWNHYAVTRANNTYRIFLNGNLLASATSSAALFTADEPLCIGANYEDVQGGVSNYNTRGYIDDLRITRGIARYTQNFIPPSVALPRQ